MSDSRAVLQQGYGVPMVWLFNYDGEILLNEDNSPLSKYVTDFEYVYDEESDDRCEINLQFDKLDMFNHKSVQQDVKIQVQWGYLVANKEFIKSPKLKVAVRDIKRFYKDNKLHVTLLCTDIPSYLKLFQSNTTYANPDIKSGLSKIDNFNKHLWDYIVELSQGEFVPTVTFKDKTILKDKSGDVVAAEYDRKSGKITVARENTAIVKRFYREFHVAKTQMGKGKAIWNAIDDLLKWINAENGGRYQIDGTGDELNIYQRNFDQEPFKSFTFAGTTGELISFDSSTDTRKVQKTKAQSSDINPYTKKIETEEVSTADTTDTIDYDFSKKPGEPPLPPEAINAWIDSVRVNFKENIENPENQELPKGISYKTVVGNRVELLNNNSVDGNIRFINVDLQTIFTLPEFKDLVEANNIAMKDRFLRQQPMIQYLTDKLQKKNTATAQVIGDPELIKKRTYNFLNLHSVDSGKWYASKVTHRINSSGYTTTLDLLRDMGTIIVNKNSAVEDVKPVVDETEENEYKVSDILEEIKYEHSFIYQEDKDLDGIAEFHTVFDDDDEAGQELRRTYPKERQDIAREQVKELNANEDYKIKETETVNEAIDRMKKRAEKLKKEGNADRY